jgi:hypothetical protein
VARADTSKGFVRDHSYCSFRNPSGCPCGQRAQGLTCSELNEVRCGRDRNSPPLHLTYIAAGEIADEWVTSMMPIFHHTKVVVDQLSVANLGHNTRCSSGPAVSCTHARAADPWLAAAELAIKLRVKVPEAGRAPHRRQMRRIGVRPRCESAAGQYVLGTMGNGLSLEGPSFEELRIRSLLDWGSGGGLRNRLPFEASGPRPSWKSHAMSTRMPAMWRAD